MMIMIFRSQTDVERGYMDEKDSHSRKLRYAHVTVTMSMNTRFSDFTKLSAQPRRHVGGIQ